jgi:hypothetical protein
MTTATLSSTADTMPWAEGWPSELRQFTQGFPRLPQVARELDTAVEVLYRQHGWADLPEASLWDLVQLLRALVAGPGTPGVAAGWPQAIQDAMRRAASLLADVAVSSPPALALYLDVAVPFYLQGALLRLRGAETPEQRAALVASVNAIRKTGTVMEPAEYPPQYSWEQIVGLVALGA